MLFFFFFQAEDGIRDRDVTGVQTCALPIYRDGARVQVALEAVELRHEISVELGLQVRSEEHTSELQSHHDLVCRLLLEKKTTKKISHFFLQKKNNNKKN